MSIKEDLEIILITYNRVENFKNTMAQILANESPIKDLNITILDNDSDDETSDYCQEVVKNNQNIKYIKNACNVGISGNIIKAMEIASKKWLWVLCDDDNYDWSVWPEIENALNQDYDAVLTGYCLGHRSEKYAYQINVMSFLPHVIYRTKHIDKTTIQNAYAISATLLPHHAIGCKVINENGKIYVPEKILVNQGSSDKYYENKDVYIRKMPKKELFYNIQSYNLFWGYIQSYQLIQDPKMRYECCDILCIGNSFESSMHTMFEWGITERQLFDVYNGISKEQKKILLKALKTRFAYNIKTDDIQERWIDYAIKEQVFDDSKVKIFLSYHKPAQSFETNVFQPIFSGSSQLNLDSVVLKDNTFNNIASKNEYYGELTKHYWVWQNYLQYAKAEYVGFSHYDRFLDFNMSKIENPFESKFLLDFPKMFNEYTEDNIYNTIKDYDVVVPQKITTDGSIYDLSLGSIPENDLNELLNVIGEFYPQYLSSTQKFLLGNEIYAFLIFVMKKELVNEYFKWAFSILNAIEEKFNLQQESKKLNIKIPVNLAEILFNIWLQYNVENKNLSILESTSITVDFDVKNYLNNCLNSIEQAQTELSNNL